MQNFDRLGSRPARCRIRITPEQVPALAEAHEKGLSLAIVFQYPPSYPFVPPGIELQGAKCVPVMPFLCTERHA
jgi:hypothetical protein